MRLFRKKEESRNNQMYEDSIKRKDILIDTLQSTKNFLYEENRKQLDFFKKRLSEQKNMILAIRTAIDILDNEIDVIDKYTNNEISKLPNSREKSRRLSALGEGKSKKQKKRRKIKTNKHKRK